VGPLQRLLLPSEHWPQAPVGWHAGVAPAHSPSPAQARQVCVARLHTGAMPLHCAFDVQGTQVALVTSQTGVAPEQRLALVAEQTPQAPLGSQAGVAPLQSTSPPQARQVCVAALHTGVMPLHCTFDVHETQVPAGV
jgi:hypothetical protein